MDILIFNRKRPVPLNFEDLNRIESWTDYLFNYLRALGYVVYVQTKTWEINSIPWKAEIDRIRNNIITLHNTFHALPEWREISFTNSLNFDQVNIMEWDLHTINTWLSKMVAIFCYSGEPYSGEM